MPWSLSQRERLAFERKVLERYFRLDEVKWIDPMDDTKVEVAITCSNDVNYTLRVYLPPDFPNSCPSMVVVSPSGLLQRKNGSLMNSMSGADHTLSSKDGYTQICHFLPSSWNGNNTLYQVIMKGRVWLEAYEVHLKTDDPLDRYLQVGESLLLDGIVNGL